MFLDRNHRARERELLVSDFSQDLPNGVQREWFDIARRLQLAARQANGPAIVTIQILIGERYLPAAWSEPEVVKLEPKLRVNDAIMGIAKRLTRKIDDQKT